MQQRVDGGTYSSLGHVVTFGFASGFGWLIAIVALAAIREKMEYSNVLAPLRGLGITFILTGLMAIGFMSFGGIDIALLGIGRVGNIAFNEPGSRLNSATRLILLDNASRNEAAKSFGSIESTPVSSITMGVSTILAAKKIFLMAWGEDKAHMIKNCVEGAVTDNIPASYIQTHNDAHVVIDLSAAANLTRIQRPWLVTSCEWNDKLIRSAIVWLCAITKKPILKLTNKDRKLENEYVVDDSLADILTFKVDESKKNIFAA